MCIKHTKEPMCRRYNEFHDGSTENEERERYVRDLDTFLSNNETLEA